MMQSGYPAGWYPGMTAPPMTPYGQQNTSGGQGGSGGQENLVEGCSVVTSKTTSKQGSVAGSPPLVVSEVVEPKGEEAPRGGEEAPKETEKE